MRTTERVMFRLLQTPCCNSLLCWVNPRLPNNCPECGKFIYPEIRSCVMLYDSDAILKVNGKITIDPGGAAVQDEQVTASGDGSQGKSHAQQLSAPG